MAATEPLNFQKIVLPISARKPILPFEKMAHILTARASGKSAMRPEYRVWGFSRNGRIYQIGSRRQRPELRSKLRPTPTFFTPGIPQWPSRDPIGEEGGVNLYGFSFNNCITRIDPLGLIVDTSDGFSFWEAVDQFYYGQGKTIEIPFSTIDPGWGFGDFAKTKPCTLLGGLLFYPIKDSQTGSHFDVSGTLSYKRTLQLFNGLPDVVYDKKGTSGPGHIDIVYTGSFNAMKTGGDVKNGGADYEYFIVGVITADDNVFDFDPDWSKNRGILGENVTIRVRQIQDKTGAGTDFLMKFPGSRIETSNGNCCCKETSPNTYICEER